MEGNSDINESLHHAYETCILICMRTTLNIDGELLEEARRATGIKTKTELVEAGLRALVERAARARLAALEGRITDATAPRRRRAARRGR
jgi:Arc/MetJ family transcription regulator